jgi:hypothetical protein
MMLPTLSLKIGLAQSEDDRRVEMMRRKYGDSFKEREGFSLTYLPFTALVVIEALREFPHLNASVGDNELLIHRDVSLGLPSTLIATVSSCPYFTTGRTGLSGRSRAGYENWLNWRAARNSPSTIWRAERSLFQTRVPSERS